MWLRFVGIGTLPQVGRLTLSVIEQAHFPSWRCRARCSPRPNNALRRSRIASRRRINPYPCSCWVSRPASNPILSRDRRWAAQPSRLGEGVTMVNIYVGNLSWSCTNDDLMQLFSQHGTVARAQVILDRETGRSRGFGFVEMPNRSRGQGRGRGIEQFRLPGPTVDGQRGPTPRAPAGRRRVRWWRWRRRRRRIRRRPWRRWWRIRQSRRSVLSLISLICKLIVSEPGPPQAGFLSLCELGRYRRSGCSDGQRRVDRSRRPRQGGTGQHAVPRGTGYWRRSDRPRRRAKCARTSSASFPAIASRSRSPRTI